MLAACFLHCHGLSLAYVWLLNSQHLFNDSADSLWAGLAFIHSIVFMWLPLVDYIHGKKCLYSMKFGMI